MTKERENPQAALFGDAMNQVRCGETRTALSTLLRLFSLNPCHAEGLIAASRLAGLLNDVTGADLFSALARDPENPDLLYRTGYHLINMGRPEVARSFLETCLRLMGDNADVLYELGFCNYYDRKYGRAADILKKASPDLDPERSLAADLLTIECLLYADRTEEGRRMLQHHADDFRRADRGDTVDALELMYLRNDRIQLDKPWDLRTWHFIKHGGMILAQSNLKESRGYFESLSMNALAVGAVLRLLKAVLEGLKIPLEAILYVEGESFPLAMALGSLLSRPIRSFENRSGGDELLVVADMDSLSSFSAHPVNRDDCAYLFCFQVFPLREYMLLPDIVGVMALNFRFPWQERVELIDDGRGNPKARSIPADTRDPQILGAELADAARLLPQDAKAPKIVSFYKAHRELLVGCNRERFNLRRTFNPHTPA